MTLRVSVVLPTHERPQRLARALSALRAQTLRPDEFEIVVVDDGSGPETAEVARAAGSVGGAELRMLRHAVVGGPARARNVGWRVARAPLVAFTDDDCEATPRWLEEVLAVWDGDPRRFVQGPTLPNPYEEGAHEQFSHTLRVEKLGPRWETANIAYPRALLERLEGLDETFPRAAGEDADLGWRAIACGAGPAWAPKAVVYHAVTPLSRVQKLRMAGRWTEAMLAYKRHPRLRRDFTLGVFLSPDHWWLLRAAVALALPQRLWWLRWWLAAPYVLRLGTLRPDTVAVLVAYDMAEIAACVRGSIRYRTLVL